MSQDVPQVSPKSHQQLETSKVYKERSIYFVISCFEFHMKCILYSILNVLLLLFFFYFFFFQNVTCINSALRTKTGDLITRQSKQFGSS